MNTILARLCVAAATIGTLGGCVTAKNQGAYPLLERTVTERSGFDTRALRPDEESRSALDARVAELLDDPLTAESLTSIALLNNPAWRALYRRLGVAEADVLSAKIIGNPGLHTIIRFPEGGGGTNLDFDLVQEFVQLLTRPARVRMAEEQFAEAQLRAAHAALDLVRDARAAYYAYAEADAALFEHSRMFEAAETATLLARETYKAGNMSELEAARHEVHLEHRRIELTEAKRAHSADAEALNVLMGLRDAEPVWFLDMRPFPEPDYAPPTLPELADTAIAQRLDLQAAGKELEIRAQALGLTRNWRYVAELEIGGNAEREFDGEWVFGPSIGFEIPIFNRRQDDIVRGESMLRESEETFLGLTAEIAAEVRDSYRRVNDARDLAISLRDRLLPLRERISALTQREYNFMLADTFHLIEAKEEEFEARIEYAHALRNYATALADLEHAVGGRLPDHTGTTPETAEPETPVHETPPAHEGEHHHD